MTTMGICQWRILVLASSLLSLMLNTSNSNAESIIAVDIGTMKGSRDASHMAVASVTIDNDDLFTMPMFTFTGMWDGEDAAVYTKVEATSRKMDSGANEIVWRGIIADATGHGFATLIRDENGNVFGTFTTKLAAYDLLNIPGGSPQVRTTLWENALPGSAIVKDESFLVDSSNGQKNQEVTMAGSFEPDYSGNVVTSIGEEAVRLENVNRKLIRSDEERNLQGKPVVDILIIVTDRARCNWVGLSSGCPFTDMNNKPMFDQMIVQQAVTNKALGDVGTGVTVRIVKIILLAPGYDRDPGKEALDDLTDSRFLFNNWRLEYGADLVAMMTGNLPDDATAAGVAYPNSHESANSIEQLKFFVFTHEIGHNFGAFHNREDCDPPYHPYAHALQVPSQEFRTVMAYPCPNNDCPPIPFYSANGYTYGDAPMGDATHDNARVIRENGPKVAAWMASKAQPTSPPPPAPTSRPPPTPPAPTPPAPTPPAPVPSPVEPPSCFSSFNTVNVKDVGEIPMNQLKIGDFIKTRNEKFTQVYGFGHYDHDMKQEFIQIILDDDTSKNSNIPFEVSSEHLVFVERNNKLYSIPASEIIIGDRLDNKKVEAIHIVSRRGVYAPLTASGDLFVNGGVLVSNYVNILHSNSVLNQHQLGHALFFPQRLICSYSIDICKKESYINGYGFLVYIIVKIGSIINMSGWLGNMIVTILSIPLVGLVSILESITMFRLIIVTGTLAVVGRYTTLMKKF